MGFMDALREKNGINLECLNKVMDNFNDIGYVCQEAGHDDVFLKDVVEFAAFALTDDGKMSAHDIYLVSVLLEGRLSPRKIKKIAKSAGARGWAQFKSKLPDSFIIASLFFCSVDNGSHAWAIIEFYQDMIEYFFKHASQLSERKITEVCDYLNTLQIYIKERLNMR